MAEFFQQVINGLSTGSIYVLVAVGVTLVFGVSRLVNFAQGGFIVVGSYFTWALVSTGLSYWAAIVPAALGVGVVGIAADRGLLRWTLARPFNGFVVSLGLVIFLEGLLTEIWGARQKSVASPLTGGVIDIASIRVAPERVLAFAVMAAAVIVLYYLLRRTNIGRSMRAAAENRDAAALVGVNVSQSISAAFFIGAVLAGLGGAVLAILFPFTPYSGGAYIIKGLAVALLGGLGSIHGALIVGLGLGVVESLGSAYGIGSEFRDGYAYIAMIAILIWRPSGLFGGASASR